MTMLNLLSVRAFGESEFWLSGIKVAAIVVFIAIAAIAVGGDMVADKALPAPLYAYGGFIPFGPASIFSGVTAVILALVGAEIITIAAADAHETGSVIARRSEEHTSEIQSLMRISYAVF